MTQETTQKLHADLAAIDEKRVALLAERDLHSFDAVVERQPAAIKKLSELNAQLDNLKHESSAIESTLRELTRRATASAEAERDEKRKSNAAAAADVLLEAEDTAALLAKALKDMSEHSLKLRAQFAEIRRLTGTGPTPESIQVNLGRSLTTAVMNSPMKIAHLAPSERCTIDDIVEGWSKQIRNWIVAAVGEKPAQKAA
jgi:cell division septum initiation protein DivIVA